jgi:deazaflavin-dependent oxidoreductase (nitroreductase family)
MPDRNDWNTRIITQFRENKGRVGPPFEGAPMMLIHHRGRRSGNAYVNPVMYLQSDDDKSLMYVFATKAGAPDNPAWYHNLLAAGSATVEVGTETFPVTVSELTGAERDRVYAVQAGRYPGFADYETKTAGVRTIPVLAIRRD